MAVDDFRGAAGGAGGQGAFEQGAFGQRAWRQAAAALGVAAPVILGVAALLGVWAFGGWLVAANPKTAAFAGFAPGPALSRLGRMIMNGEAANAAGPSLMRVGGGLMWAILTGVPLGVLAGRSALFRAATNIPFQFMRMISPLAWMPIAVLCFSTWDGAIVFLIAVASVWPILFATAHGLRKVDPAWFRTARNLGAGPWRMLTVIILPAIAQDVLTGVRLALGVAWIVLVPAEYLGVTSGLGYAINDARDTLEYDRLAATVLIIGLIGFSLDLVFQRLIARFSWIREP